MQDYLLTPVEIYMKKSLRLLIFLVTLCAFCACGTFTVLTLLGFYPNVSLIALILFDIFDFGVFFVGRVLSRKCITPDGVFHKEVITYTKLFIFLLIIIQWNFITYMIPSRDFWAYASLFVVVAVFYMDHKLILAVEGGLAISMIVSYFIKSETFLPVDDGYFVPNIVLRIVLILIIFIALWFLTFFTQRLLIKPFEKVADYDSLTGVRNRRTMYKIIDESLSEHLNKGRSVTILLCDIDDFKNVNDTYGHDCGDLVLKNVAETINQTLANEGVTFRYGGEEFVVMIDREPLKALELAEKIREDVANSVVNFNGKNIKVTMTIGATSSNDYSSVDNLISKADDLMYKGKLSGKNKVVSE